MSDKFDVKTYQKIAQKGDSGNNLLHIYFSNGIWAQDHNCELLKLLLQKGVDPNQKNFTGHTPVQGCAGFPAGTASLLHDQLTQYGWWISNGDVETILKTIIKSYDSPSSNREGLYQKFKKHLENQTQMSIDTHPAVHACLLNLLTSKLDLWTHRFIFENEQLLEIIINNQLAEEKEIVKLIIEHNISKSVELLHKKGFYCCIDNAILKDFSRVYDSLRSGFSMNHDKIKYLKNFEPIFVFKSEKQKKRVINLFNTWFDLDPAYTNKKVKEELLIFLDTLPIVSRSYYEVEDDSKNLVTII